MLDVLLEDNHCLAVNKPAGLLTQGDASGDVALIDLAREYIKERYQKPGNVYLGLVHRLDRPVSGVVLLARTSKAAARLTEQFRTGEVEKLYWAIVEGRPTEDVGEWSDWLRKDEARNVVAVVPPGTREAKEARLAYEVKARWEARTLVELSPRTGRSHQLRVQLASRGLPIVGDLKYGARSTLVAVDGGHRIALHARRLTFSHPTRREAVTVVASEPADWPGPSGPN